MNGLRSHRLLWSTICSLCQHILFIIQLVSAAIIVILLKEHQMAMDSALLSPSSSPPTLVNTGCGPEFEGVIIAALPPVIHLELQGSERHSGGRDCRT